MCFTKELPNVNIKYMKLFEVKSIRKTIYAFSLTLVVLVFGAKMLEFGGLMSRTLVELNKIYGTIALIFLYFTLLIGPLVQYSFLAPSRSLLKRSRRAMGISAWVFSFLHGFIGFFGIMLGQSFDLNNVQFIPESYMIPLGLGSASLAILTLLATISTDIAIEKMGKNWYIVQRLVYIAGVAVLGHVFWIGSSFQNISSPKSIIVIAATSFLILLWSLRLDLAVFKRFPHVQKAGIVTTITILGLSIFLSSRFLPVIFSSNSLTSTPQPSSTFSPIHLRHLQNLQSQGATIPGNPLTVLENAKRYTAQFTPTSAINTNQETELKFQIFNADNGQTLRTFNRVYEKFSHLIVVNEDLGGFEHIHPEFIDGAFVIKKTFSQQSNYRLYLGFTPRGDIEQQFAFRLQVGETRDEKQLSLKAGDATQKLDEINIKLDKSDLGAKDLSLGKGMFIYKITNQNDEPYKDVRPYLGAFGHLSMINTATGELVHVHPNLQTPPKPEDRSDGSVEFVPFGIIKPIEAGIYKLFGEFNLGGTVKTVEHVVEIGE
jgi:DMSO/TMAO reductase YedYZ heme-binding membrane subunit